MIIGHIGARSGSKGLVNKNLKLLKNKPLIQWSIEQLVKCKKIDKIVVSTDSRAIYKLALKFGSVDIGLRPKKISGDNIAKFAVWKHVIKKLDKIFNNIEMIVDLDCTSPLRKISDIENAIKKFKMNKADIIMSCCVARKNPYFNLVEFNKKGFLEVSKKHQKKIVTRQSAPLVLEHAASTYVISPTYLKNAKHLFKGNILPYIMPYERCIDIDSKFDFSLVEYLLKDKKNETIK